MILWRISNKVFGENISCYIFGLKLLPNRTFSNDGFSDHTWVVASSHPLNSITWHWCIYWSKPKTIWCKYFWKNFGFWMKTQELMKVK